MRKEYTHVEKAEALDDFELFLFNMDYVLEMFIEKAEVLDFVFDYSLDSLNRLEAYAIKLDAKPLSDFHGHASQYLGETVRKIFGGHWELSLNMKENSMNYGKPVIVGHSKYEVEFPPYQIMRNFILRPAEGLLQRAILSQTSPQKIDLSDLPTQEEPTDSE